jgi:hypothetical protein
MAIGVVAINTAAVTSVAVGVVTINTIAVTPVTVIPVSSAEALSVVSGIIYISEIVGMVAVTLWRISPVLPVGVGGVLAESVVLFRTRILPGVFVSHKKPVV